MSIYFQPLVHFSGVARFLPEEADSVRLWGGEGALEWEGAVWEGAGLPNARGSLLAVSSLHAQQDVPDARVTIDLAITAEAHGMFWAHDFGGLDVDVGYLVSEDGARTWARVPRRFRGRTSETLIRDAVARITVETYLGDVDRGIVRYWNDASHRERFPGDDFFRDVAALEEGIDLEGWPP